MKYTLLLFLISSVVILAEDKPAPMPVPIDSKIVATYWHAAFNAAQAASAKEKADEALKQAAEAVKSSCSGDVQVQSGEFVCVVKPAVENSKVDQSK